MHTNNHCSPHELAATIQGRRSVRAYQDRPVGHDQVIQLLEAARWAPSPHGRQPWRFAAITKREVRKRLAQAMGDRWRQQLELDGHEAQIVQARLERSHQRIIAAPLVVVPCLYLEELDQYADAERQAAEHTMAVQSLGCAVQNMLLMAYSMGLDCGWMCAPLFCPELVCEALGLETTLIPQALITVGYAAKEPVRRPHRSVDDLLVLYE